MASDRRAAGIADPAGTIGPARVTEIAAPAGTAGAARVAGAAGAEGVAGAGGVNDDPQERARQVCLRMLTAAPRTSAQLADAMRRKGVPDEAAQAVLSRLAEVGLIDDAAFARAWVESRHHARGLARRALAAELEKRGVRGEDVRTAVGALGPDEEIATARRLVARAMTGTRGRPLPVRIRRLVGLLARKGYPAPLAYRVVREALEQEGIDTADAEIDLDSMGEAAADVSDE
ncbi:MAG TPA: regulatory protein RecX [Streptosporangiaceae bacterium]